MEPKKVKRKRSRTSSTDSTEPGITLNLNDGSRKSSKKRSSSSVVEDNEDFDDYDNDDNAVNGSRAVKRVSFGDGTNFDETTNSREWYHRLPDPYGPPTPAGYGDNIDNEPATSAKKRRHNDVTSSATSLTDAELSASLGGGLDLGQLNVVQLQTSSKRKLQPRPLEGGDRKSKNKRTREKQMVGGKLMSQLIGDKVGGKQDIEAGPAGNDAKLDKKSKKNGNKKKSAKKNVEQEETTGMTDDTKAKLSALNYLVLWRKSPEVWKFQKVRQTWLLQHMYDEEAVPKKHFKYLLKYLSGLQGQAKRKTLEEAQEVLQKGEEGARADGELRSLRAGKLVQVLDSD